MKLQVIVPVLAFLMMTSFIGEQKDPLYSNYVAAIKNESTIQYFLVVKVKNLNTGQVREYCSKGNFLKGAIHREYQLDYNSKGIEEAYNLAITNKERYFEFKNDSAIWNIGGVWTYSMEELSLLENKINFDSLATQIGKSGKWSREISDDKTMIMYAHCLFNRGILTGENNCFGGTLMFINN